MALTHTDTGAHPRQSGVRPRRSPAPPMDPTKANIHYMPWLTAPPGVASGAAWLQGLRREAVNWGIAIRTGGADNTSGRVCYDIR